MRISPIRSLNTNHSNANDKSVSTKLKWILKGLSDKFDLTTFDSRFIHIRRKVRIYNGRLALPDQGYFELERETAFGEESEFIFTSMFEEHTEHTSKI